MTTMLCPWCREAFDPANRQFHTCTLAPAPRPDHVRVRYHADDTRFMSVDFAWKGNDRRLDRPVSSGMVVLARHVHRLTRAFLDGRLYEDPRVAWDIHGQTYAEARCKVMGRTANADLTRLGY